MGPLPKARGADVTVQTSPQTPHTPVLLTEALGYLAVREGGTYIDCTAGAGGHSAAIAKAMGEKGSLLCIDQDNEALEFARARLAPYGSRVSFARGNFRDLHKIAADKGFESVDSILMDLGVSSIQLDTPERGFAFAHEGPLDMRMDQSSDGMTAADIVNTWDEQALANLFREHGEVRGSRRIARAVIAARPLRSTWDLAKAVEQAAGGARDRTQQHPATKVFLALRIRVNGELDSLSTALPLARSLLGFGPSHQGGRMVTIAFHSLEDRIVKQFFGRESRDCLCPPVLPECRCDHRATLSLLTRRAVRPSDNEVARNPRSRSGVLRAAQRKAVE
ncbi:MAG: 16S rRNA (cytosine(1402)-N(4))-methyltransferase [Dehalococcoidia bacterium]|nr:16S rRNA (cytosine(1402)-N(4))-methyltransferase [Dehalococcoidia bacterium]|tara:strand:- start:744 stop:1748 length:1005 start_codon:yes stop_codon:yes gene_type:complete